MAQEDSKKYIDLFKPKLFTRDSRSQNSQSRVLSPMERSEIMYKEGKDKLQKLNDSNPKLNLSYYCEELTLKPKINEKSQAIVKRKSPDRSVIESLYSDA